MITLVKFVRNELEGSSNELITRTLGKIGVIESNTFEQMKPKPRHDEFWYVEIAKEVKEGTTKGCYILKPILKIGTTRVRGWETPDIVRLIPGTFRIEKRGNTLFIFPHKVDGTNGPNWILEGELRRYLLRQHRDPKTGYYNVNSVIVVFDKQVPEDFVSKQIMQETEETPILDLDTIANKVETLSDFDDRDP